MSYKNKFVSKSLLFLSLSIVIISISSLDNYTFSKTIEINNDNLYSQDSLKKKFYESYYKHDNNSAISFFEKIKDNKKDLELVKLYATILTTEGKYDKAKYYFNYILQRSDDYTLNNYAKFYLKLISKYPKIKKKIVITKAESDNNICGIHNYVKWDYSYIKVYLPEPDSQIKRSPDNIDYVNVVKKSFYKWTEKVPQVKFSFISDKNYANIIVNFHSYYESFNTWDIISEPTYYGNLGKRVSFVNLPLMINPRNTPGGENESFYSEKDIYAMAMHQAGHAIGLKESSDYNSVMNRNSKFLNFDLSGKTPDAEPDEDDIKELKDNFKSLNSDCDNPVLAKKYQSKDMRDNYKNNYLCFLSGEPELHSDGKSFLRQYSKWDKSDFPLKVYVPLPPADLYKIDNPEHFKELTKQAFMRWVTAAPDIVQLKFVDNENDAKVSVRWSDYFEHKDYWGLASTLTYPDNPNHKRKCYIDLAVRAQPGWYSDNPISFGDETFTNIATHEMGHALGLDHGPDQNGATGNGSLITDRDINTLKEMYSVPIGYQFLCRL